MTQGNITVHAYSIVSLKEDKLVIEKLNFSLTAECIKVSNRYFDSYSIFISSYFFSVFNSPLYNASLYLLGVLGQSKLRLHNVIQTMEVKYSLSFDLFDLQQSSNKNYSIQHRCNY